VIENCGSPERSDSIQRSDPIPKSAARRKLALAADRHVVLFVGRAEASKGFDEVVALARARPGILVLAAGVVRCGELPPNLRALGFCDAGTIALLNAASDLVVLPSRYEGCSIALIEALTGDRPIVATATGCFERAGGHDFGVVVPIAPGERLARDFISAVDSVLAAPERFRPLTACRERFSFERFAGEWRALIDEVAARGR
jgi:glycosyltransferase involved in cell wall biosynthesis